MFGHVILDSVVAPHHKIVVSRQLIKKTDQFSLRDAHGHVIDLHGAFLLMEPHIRNHAITSYLNLKRLLFKQHILNQNVRRITN